MREEEVDQLVVAWDERLRRIDENLIALEAEPTYQMLSGGARATLAGKTREHRLREAMGGGLPPGRDVMHFGAPRPPAVVPTLGVKRLIPYDFPMGMRMEKPSPNVGTKGHSNRKADAFTRNATGPGRGARSPRRRCRGLRKSWRKR